MKSVILQAIAAALIGTTSIIATRCLAQDVTAPPQSASAPTDTTPLAVQQMDQLVAPVALYDDPLLVEVLTAASHPVDIVDAQGWISNPVNGALKGDTLATALANQKWDPSVKALVPFPQILNLMCSHLDWTEHLGDAFVANRAAVMESIQHMRRRAQSAGTLNSSAQQIVVDDGGFVTITPPASDVYIPAYDPWCVYGSWPVSAPFYYTSWPGYCTAEDGRLDFGVGFRRPFGYRRWGDIDWLHHDIRIYHNRSSDLHFGHEHIGAPEHHDDLHQVGVRFGNTRSVGRFGGGRLGGGGPGVGHFGGGGIGGGHGGGGGGRR